MSLTGGSTIGFSDAGVDFQNEWIGLQYSGSKHAFIFIKNVYKSNSVVYITLSFYKLACFVVRFIIF